MKPILTDVSDSCNKIGRRKLIIMLILFFSNRRSGFKSGNWTIEIDGVGPYDYTYDIRRHNRAGRTLDALSRTAEQDMLKCEGCPDPIYKKFYDYYGQADYGHQFVTAAFDGGATTFTNGNVDFTQANNISRIGKSSSREWSCLLSVPFRFISHAEALSHVLLLQRVCKRVLST